MYIFRLPFVRTLIFCILVLILLFTNKLNVLAFFLIGGVYSFIQSIASKREFDITTGNKFIDFGWYPFLLITILLIIIDSF